MNSDRVKGAIDELVGSTKRKAGHLIGNTQLEVKGLAQQVKGKVESGWGKGKDAVRGANKVARVQHDPHV
jgi:uncharacterized protein YjbJ (UPF0337 family)